MHRRTVWFLLFTFCVILVCVSIGDGRKVSGSSRKSTWSRPSPPKPQQQPHYGHNNQEHTRLTYGHNEQPATAHKPSAPVDHNPYQPSAPKLPGHDNTGSIQKNVGWNANSAPNPGGSVNQQNRPIGWNVGQNQPPPWSAGAQPPPYPKHDSHQLGAGAPPPPYSKHDPHPFGGGAPPPPYPGHGGYQNPNQNQPHYPSYQPGYQHYPQSGGYPQSHAGGYGGLPGGGGFGGYPGGGGFGGYPGGGGGFGGYPGGFGGHGGYGGVPGGYSGGNRGNTLLAAGAGVLGGAVLGAALYNLASDRNNHHVYSPYNQQPYVQGGDTVNVAHSIDFDKGVHSIDSDKGSFSHQMGNLTCVSVYNARAVSRWANNTLKTFYQSFPPNSFNANGTSNVNFTVVPGEIIHNETLFVTCCGTEHGAIKLIDLVNGKSPDVNCVQESFNMPFRRLTFVPTNATAAPILNGTAVSNNNNNNTMIMGDQPKSNQSEVVANVTTTIMSVISDSKIENATFASFLNNMETTKSPELPTTLKPN